MANAHITRRDAAALHAENIYEEVYAVGVGNANVEELQVIASDPSHVLFDRNFDELTIDQLQHNITHRLCGK